MQSTGDRGSTSVRYFSDRDAQDLLGAGVVGYASGRLRPSKHVISSGRRAVRVDEVKLGPDLWFLAVNADANRRLVVRIVRGDREAVVREGIHAAVRFMEDPMFQTAAQVETAPAPVARRATHLAAWLSGPRRPHLYEEWSTVLAGFPEDGVVFTTRRQLLLALGFFFAAVRMRASDVARPAWRPVDWLLGTSSRTNAFLTSVVGTQAIYIVGTVVLVHLWPRSGNLAASLVHRCLLWRAGSAAYGASS